MNDGVRGALLLLAVLAFGAAIGWGYAQLDGEEDNRERSTGGEEYGRVTSVRMTCEHVRNSGDIRQFEGDRCATRSLSIRNIQTTLTVRWPDGRVETITMPGVSPVNTGGRWPPR